MGSILLHPGEDDGGDAQALCLADGKLAGRGGGPRIPLADVEPESTSYDFEVVAAGATGDLAYVVVYEHNEVKYEGEPGTYTLRSTHVFCREDGEWKIVHRHADPPPEDAKTS